MKLSYTIILTSLLLSLASCTTNGVFEKMTFFDDHEWKSTQRKAFTFQVDDTATLYKVFLVLRHKDAYRFKNIWLNIELRAPDSTYKVQREFTLADNEKWLGTTVDDIVEQRIPFDIHPAPFNPGKYTFVLQQVMREDPLQHVMNAGIRVEKVQ